jgi:serine protease Do
LHHLPLKVTMSLILSAAQGRPVESATLFSSVRLRAWAKRCGTAVLSAALFVPVVGGLSLAPQAVQAQALPDFTNLVDKVGPAVVNIRTTEKTRATGPSEMDPNMQEFFRRFGIPMPNNPNRRSPQQAPDKGEEESQPKGVGSGFILTSDGFVMTNAHVVEGADEVLVTLTDNREFKARIVGADKRADVAVVKINATGLPTVQIGDVNKLKVGEWVMAIGSPFGLENTVTAGIVSAKARDTGEFLPLIQTDVAINPGNSGGPLINLRGEVVGINSQIYSRSGGFMGISFAIPIDEAMRVSDQLRANGRVIRGRIGVSIAPVSKDLAESLSWPKPIGALVQGVEPDSPAAKGGVEPGDIILKVDGRAVEKSGDLPRIIGGIRPGAKASLQVWRRGTNRDLVVTVGEFEAEKSAAAKPAAPEPSSAKTLLGISASELTADQRKELKLQGGVKVDAVEGAAAKAGLREGDVILAVNNTDVSDLKAFLAVTKGLGKGKPVTLMVRRGEWVNYLILRP